MKLEHFVKEFFNHRRGRGRNNSVSCLNSSISCFANFIFYFKMNFELLDKNEKHFVKKFLYQRP